MKQDFWIARNMDGGLRFFQTMPAQCHGVWSAPKSGFPIPWGWFEEITFENSPKRVTLTINEE